MTNTPLSADVLVIGWGLAGLVAAGEALDAGRRVILVDQEPVSYTHLTLPTNREV